MVMKMNKEKFINVLAEKLNCDTEYSRRVSDLLEDNFLIGKKNKEKTINSFITELKVSKEEAEKIYETASSVIASAIKDKIKHPFKDLDK